MSRKVFTAGEVLAASDVNSFLMDQSVMSFAGTAARGSAIGTAVEGMVTYLNDSNSLSVNNGTDWTIDRTIQVFAGTAARGSAIPSPVEGMYAHLNDTDALTFYNGSAWANAGATSGLTLISSTPFTSTTTLDVDNVFSTNYDSYQLIVSFTSTTVIDATIQFRVSGTTATTNYNSTKIVAYNSVTSNRVSSASSAELLRTASDGSIAQITLNNPFLAQRTNGLSTSYDSEGYLIGFGFNHTTATSYTGFRLNLNNSTGIIRVYGVAK
jgi:hypothetical protein